MKQSLMSREPNLIDISQEIMSCRTFPGDPVPKAEALSRISRGDICNLSAFSMCAHNGTHVDAPFHFINDGKTIDRLGLSPFVGKCFVAGHDGSLYAPDASAILSRSGECGCSKRILIKGNAIVTAEAARVFAGAGILLLGNESQTVGPPDSPAEVHNILLGKGIVLLEGIVLAEAAEGPYILAAAPLLLGGFDGAPCRAFLMT